MKKKRQFRMSNNALAVFAILIIISSIYLNYLFFKSSQDIQIPTGQATGQARLCITSGIPSVNLIYPQEYDVFNGTIHFNATANSTRGEDWIDYTNFSYGYATVTTNVATDHYDGDIYYNASWDTTVLADGNCNYSIRAVTILNDYTCGITPYDVANPIHYATVNNQDIEPEWDSFKNSLTTNFTALSTASLHDWILLNDVVIGVPNEGLINFSGIDITVDNQNLSACQCGIFIPCLIRHASVDGSWEHWWSVGNHYPVSLI